MSAAEGTGVGRAQRWIGVVGGAFGVVGGLVVALLFLGDARWERAAAAQEVRLQLATIKADAEKPANEAKAAAAEAKHSAEKAQGAAAAVEKRLDRLETRIETLQGTVLEAIREGRR